MAEETAAQLERASDNGQLVPIQSAYDRIADVSAFVDNFGKSIAESKMFGCSNLQQGRVLAMACLAERRNPIELTRRYHIIGGNLSMKADVMLAEFRHRGGDHSLISRTPDRAEIELRVGKGRGAKAQRFAFTWEEAKQESYVYGKDGKTLKDNWSTPRRRMQMLWARLISDSVRVMMPEVNAGQYTPEELGGRPDDGDVIDASYTVASEPATVAPETPEPPPFDFPKTEPTGVTNDQLKEMQKLTSKLDLDHATWSKVLGKFGVPSATELSHEHAERVVIWLRTRLRSRNDRSEMDKWVEDAMQKPTATSEPAGN